MTLKPQPKPFLVIAADPDDERRLHRCDVNATSVDEAREAARVELAGVRLVRERKAAA